MYSVDIFILFAPTYLVGIKTFPLGAHKAFAKSKCNHTKFSVSDVHISESVFLWHLNPKVESQL